MGTYINYFLCTEASVRNVVLNNAKHLIKCMEGVRLEFPDEFIADVYEMAAQLVANGDSAFQTTDIKKAALIDRVLSELSYYEDISSDFDVSYTLFTPCKAERMKEWRYTKNIRTIVPNASEELVNLYNRLLFSGRELVSVDGYKYESPDGTYRISWLTRGEVAIALNEMNAYFTYRALNSDAEDGVHFFKDALNEASDSKAILVAQVY